ncbi:MAG: hypothetical protein KatS3mg130_0174 [Candidatus Sumerlaea sp.]|jgi:peptidyl-prolyl cis-trans isomerase A (cyclophilin A)|nr:MAG: hypothetical protein KatS3mg130_0174 [Candidatus Sumerlaea sp.]
MHRGLAVLFLCALAMAGWSVETTGTVGRGLSLWSNATDEVVTEPLTLTEGTYAVFHTSDGEFLVRLYPDKAPKTVENFVQLATGKKEWTHPITEARSSRPLYNNTLIYNIVEDVAIKGGDPTNKGEGGPGYMLDLEVSPDLTFNERGVLAMQSASKNKANGSRWFITLVPMPDYTGRYSAFGKVIAGLDVVRQISRKPTKRPLEPLDPTVVYSIEIIEVPPKHVTTARLATENGIRVVTVDKEFKSLEKPAEEEEETTGTKASSEETTTTP